MFITQMLTQEAQYWESILERASKSYQKNDSLCNERMQTDIWIWKTAQYTILNSFLPTDISTEHSSSLHNTRTFHLLIRAFKIIKKENKNNYDILLFKTDDCSI